MVYLFLADAILILHTLIVLFNLGALPLIWVGYFRHWHFIRNFAFRSAHLLLIAFVAIEAFFGAICPLTSWEDALRLRAGAGSRYERGYVAYWLHQVIFYDLDPIFFTVAYGLFFALVIFTLFWVKPDWPKGWRRRKH
jgi:hypothetical protein